MTEVTNSKGAENEKNCDQNDAEANIEVAKVEEKEDNAPPDAFFTVHLLFFFLGLLHFIPTSFFNVATKYWMYKFRNTTEGAIDDAEHRTYMQKEFGVFSTIFGSTPLVIFITLTTIYGQHINARVRIVWTIFSMLVVFSMSTIFINVNTDTWQVGFFCLTMFFIFVKSAANSILGVSLFEVLSKFPRKYLVWYLAGEGVAGPFNSALQLASLAIGTTIHVSALIYFMCGVFVIAMSLILFLVAKYTALYKHYIGKSDTVPRRKILSWKESKVIVKKIWSSILINIVMISGLQIISPAVTTLIVSEDKGTPWADTYYLPFTYLLRDIADFIGRTLASKLKWNMNIYLVAALSVVRLGVLIPLYLLSNAQPRSRLPVLLTHDYQYCILVLTYGISGGYLFNIAYLNIKRLVSEKEVNDGYNVLSTVIGIVGAVSSGFSYISVNML